MAALKHTGPLLGYNNNVPHGGQMFHVQTEDSGSKRPHVITHLFRDGGRIVKTTKTSYAHFLGAENMTEKVRALMRDQHKAMVIQLRDGVLDHLIAEGKVEIEEKEAPRSVPPPPSTSAAPPSAPLELLERAAAVNEREFHQEMERLSALDSPPPDSVRSRATPPPGGAGTYSFVGRSGPPAPSGAPKSSSPPSSRRPPPPRRMVPTHPGEATRNEAAAPPAVDVAAGLPRRMVSSAGPPRPSPSRGAPASAVDSDRTNVYQRSAFAARTVPDARVAEEHAHATATFGQRFKSGRRFDEVVAAFLARRS